MKKLFLVDVSSMFFRAFYAIRSLSNSKGLPTNAIYGFLSMTVKLLKEENPDYLVYCYDLKEPSFRKEIDPNYKANRSDTPEDLVPQIPYIKKVTEYLGIPSVEKAGYEADDLIGSLAHLGIKNNLQVVIVSGDKDFAQLIGPQVSMYDTLKDIRYDEAKVVEKWGVRPDRFVDYLAIVGDSSDNIPGVSGIGTKGGQKLLEDFASLDEIYSNLEKIKNPKLVQKLIEGKDSAYLSKKLVTIVTDLDLGLSIDQLKPRGLVRDELRAILRELEFKSLEKALLTETGVENTVQVEVAPTVELKENQISISSFAELIHKGDEIWGFESERGLLTIQGENVYLLSGDPLSLGKLSDEKQLQWKGFDLKRFFTLIKPDKPIVKWDSMLAAYVLRAGDTSDFREVYQSYLKQEIDTLPSLSQLGGMQLILEKELQEALNRQKMMDILNSIELPLISILFRMEQRGITLDCNLLREQSKELSEEIKLLEKEIHLLAGEVFNIGSPKQLSNILFKKLEIPSGKKTKTGHSTDSDVLEKLADQFPICNKVISFRELTKLKSTYVDALPLLVRSDTGRLHSSFNQALTTTGRLSSSHPNLQNIPIRTEKGARIRKAFVAAPGANLVSADYSQIELRILAHIANDQGLIAAFERGFDIHTATAAEVFGIKPSEVTADLRRKAKAVNFGIAYGQGVFGLAESLRIERREATDIINSYFSKFPGVKRYMTEVTENAQSRGYVETLFGRRRYIDELKSSNHAIRKFGERAAINAPIQGTASDLVKIAMIRLDQSVKLDMLLQVHDELIFEGPENETENQLVEIRQVMTSAATLKVPLEVNVVAGKNWDEAHA